MSDTISAVWPFSEQSSTPRSTDHSFAVESIEPVATTAPVGSKARQTISVVCPRRVCSSSPVLASHSFAVLSNEPVTILSPNGLLKAIA